MTTQPRGRTCIFTIAAKNYLHFVRTLMDSVAQFAPDADRFLGLCDEPDDSLRGETQFRTIALAELDIPERERFVFQYSLLEISTAIKPFVFAKLLREHGYDKVIYFDPDIRVYRPLDDMLALLDEHPVLLTPHLTEPIRDDKEPSENAILLCGVHNLGYMGLRRTSSTETLVSWWQDRLLKDCVVDFERGLFVDQKWMDLAPSLCEGVRVHRDPGWNVAYWNLHGRRVEKVGAQTMVNGQPLTFYHFSGFDPARGIFSKHQTRFTLETVAPAVRELCDDYATQLRRHGYPGNQSTPYAHATFSDGTLIPTVARKLYRRHRDRFGSDWPAFQRWLNEPAEVFGRSSPLVTNLALAVYHEPMDLGLAQQFSDVLGTHARGFAEWFVADAAELAAIPDPFIAPVRAALAASQGGAGTSGGTVAKALYQLAWRFKDKTHAFLPLSTRQSIHDWLFRRAFVGPSSKDRAQPKAPNRDGSAGRGGINVVGYVHAELGVGEAARSTLRAASTAGIPYSLVDYRKGVASRMEEKVDDQSRRGQHYGVNLFHVNADQMPFVARELGKDFFRGRYNIGFWNWELPELPDAYLPAFDLLDEVWAPSAFCHDTFAKKSRKPVVRIPYCVDFEVPKDIGRRELGLPEKGFLFLFMFDAFSIPERKNPAATIEAFRRARRDLPDDARLVLKVINGDKAPEGLALLRDAERDPAIIILRNYLDRAALSGLFQAVDAYVSLHRSEGFGLTLAEAMYLGKPVIATGWSSNTDFTTPWSSLLVKYRLVELAQDHGPYKKGNVWAEPDVDDAASCMVQLVRDPNLYAHLSEAGRNEIRTNFSPAAVGAAIRARLGFLGLLQK